MEGCLLVSILLDDWLHWRHMSVMGTQQPVQGNNKENMSIAGPMWKESTSDPYKKLVMWKVFPCCDIMLQQGCTSQQGNILSLFWLKKQDFFYEESLLSHFSYGFHCKWYQHSGCCEKQRTTKWILNPRIFTKCTLAFCKYSGIKNSPLHQVVAGPV